MKLVCACSPANEVVLVLGTCIRPLSLRLDGYIKRMKTSVSQCSSKHLAGYTLSLIGPDTFRRIARRLQDAGDAAIQIDHCIFGETTAFVICEESRLMYM